LNKLHTFPVLRRVIRTWLAAGVLDGGQLLTTDKGAPQGSAISPLLVESQLDLIFAQQGVLLFTNISPEDVLLNVQPAFGISLYWMVLL